MPIYEYRCAECGHELDALRKISDTPLVDCPACGKPALRKLVSASGFRLKGGGWYETDFKSGKKKNIAKSESAKAEKPAGDKVKASTDSGKKTGSS